MKTTKLFSQLLKVKEISKTVKRLDSNVASTFKFSDLQIEVTQTRREKPDPENLIFGRNFSDHMFEVPWNVEEGWGTPKICPLHPLEIHPAAKVLHYAAELFEGSKAYRGYDNRIRLFRPELNMLRMLRSAERASLPTFDKDEMLKCLKKLVEIDEEWIPSSKKCSLYIRPTLIGTEKSLGVNRPKEALLYILTGPVGPYFPTGFRPVSLFADPKYVRAWEGGCGTYKMGANYAPTVMIQRKAVEKGCQQVLWLYGEENMITEVGTMNVFVLWINENGEKELITPCLDSGLILPGITRQSILELAREWNYFKVTERNFTMKDLIKALNENRLIEFFGAGTACVVCPVESILFSGKLIKLPSDVNENSLSMKFYEALSDIQHGKVDHPWALIVK